MKQILFAASLLLSVFAAKAQEQKPDDVVKFNTERYEFGKIKQGVPVTTFFELKNTSDKPIILESVTASCGCTTPEYTKEPIVAGGTTKIKVGYNAAALNHFEKDVFVKIAGISSMKTVKISGDVMDAAAYEAYMASVKKQEAQKNEMAKAQATPKKTTPVKKTKVKTKTK